MQLSVIIIQKSPSSRAGVVLHRHYDHDDSFNIKDAGDSKIPLQFSHQALIDGNDDDSFVHVSIKSAQNNISCNNGRFCDGKEYINWNVSLRCNGISLTYYAKINKIFC